MQTSDQETPESLNYGVRQTLFREEVAAEQTDTTLYKSKKGYLYSKRLLDMAFALTAAILLAPLFVIVGMAIKLDSKGPVIYTQPRVTKNGRVFKMYKFRSMCANADTYLKELEPLNEKDGPVFKLANDPRVTRVGKLIRRTSIDELPQLLNVIKGEMTIVGPRPPLVNEVAQYTPHQMLRLTVTTGLTCYWQISGRSELSFEEWVELDMKYIREQSLRTDISIILKTIPVVLLGRGAY